MSKADKIIGALESVTKKWAKQRKAEERHASALNNRAYVMTRRRSLTIKDAAWRVMEQAYMKASANGRLPAHARQVMYAARPLVQDMTGKNLDDNYFTQTLLPNYIAENYRSWNVVFDARGHFYEPHTGEEVPLGTIEVRNYLGRVASHRVEKPSFDVREKLYPTLGPKHRYGAVLFVEKEGFMPLFEAVHLAERYDLAIMSTKGMSVTASRELIDRLCSGHNIPLLVFHDFDKSGFSIAGTLKRSTRRYSFGGYIQVIDAGMRLGDIDGLPSEAATPVQDKRKAASNLRLNGATPKEIEYLLQERVELNAFASDELVAWIEGKLAEHGVKKVIPDDATLTAAYMRASEHAAAQKAIDEAVAELHKTEPAATVPDNLRALITERLSADSKLTWDAVVAEIAEREEVA
jgi:hypothetical protein